MDYLGRLARFVEAPLVLGRADLAAFEPAVLDDARTRRVVEAVHEIETLKGARDLGTLLVPALRTPFRIQGGFS